MNNRFFFILATCLLWVSLSMADSPKVVCFGDSITKRGYPAITASLLGVEMINAGVGGHSTAKGLRRIEKDVLAHKADVVVVAFGTNDLRADAERVYVPVKQYQANLVKIAQLCKKQGSQVIISTLPPIRSKTFFTRHKKDEFEKLGGLEAIIESYAQAARDVAKSESATLVDLNQLLAKEPTWMSPDGVHPSPDGNAIIAKHISRAMLPLLPKKKQPSSQSLEADVVVFGGTSAGIVAAVQAARMRKSVILLEPYQHIGGLTTGGLGATDIGNKNVIGGISREFYKRVAQHYQKDTSWKWETRDEFFQHRSKRTKQSEITGENGTMWTFEPSVASQIFTSLMAEVGIEVRVDNKLTKVNKQGRKITSIETSTGHNYKGKVYIDATYEGDLMAKAGVSYRVGREANSEYNETLNGIRAKTPKNQIYGSIDPYVVPGDPTSGLIPLIQKGDGGTPGDSDHRVQAYNFRLCFTDVAENRLPLNSPDQYDPKRYELAARRAEKIVASGAEPHIKQFCNPVWMPNRKTDINNSQGISTDFIGANYEYPDADYDKRAQIWQAHEDYVRGFWYFMSTNQRIPESLRNEFLKFGPCKDEFLATNGWPSQLYVREARRMASNYIMTEHHCRGDQVAKDSIGMAAYGMDSHNCQRIVKNGIARNEGDVQVHGLRPYPISLQSITPKSEECENLLVPVCVSSTHIAFGSIRMEPVFMVLGESAAITASLAIDLDSTVQEVKYEQLHPLLLATGQVLEIPGPKKEGPLKWSPKKSAQSNWNTTENWSGNRLPNEGDSVVIDQADNERLIINETIEANLGSILVGSEDGQKGELYITSGIVEASKHSSRKSRIGLRGGEGLVKQTGGTLTLNSLQIALDPLSIGTYQLDSGTLNVKRLVSREIGSISIGSHNLEGSANFGITGGTLRTRSGVSLALSNGTGTFSVTGTGSKSISIGEPKAKEGFWNQHRGGILKVTVGEKGVTPIVVNNSESKVSFAKGALLDLTFLGSAVKGYWDIMTWSGEMEDLGLALAQHVDKEIWSFEFVDTTSSGKADTLRVTAR